MCDDGRLSYALENEGRLTEARIGTAERSVEDVLAACTKEIERAETIAILLSPDSSLEQMAAIKAFAEDLGATLSGFSDGYIKEGDGDDYLIKDDKAANRAGLTLLAIDTSRSHFEEAVKKAQLLINFDNDLSLTYSESELKKLLVDTKIIALSTHENTLTAVADISVPVASYSEYAGSIINCDDILQTFDKALTKNNDPGDILAITASLGGPLQNREEAFAELQKAIPALDGFEYDNIPAQGLKLNDSEAANVTA